MNHEYISSTNGRPEQSTDSPAGARYSAAVAAAGSFRSALGGEATIICATADPAAETTGLPIYFNGGHAVHPEKYLRYIAEAYGRTAFSVVYDDKRRRDSSYWIVSHSSAGEKRACLDRNIVRRFAAGYAGTIVSQGQIDLAADIITAMDEAGIERMDAIGQSVGALCVGVAAAQAPERISNIVLPYPAGIIKPDVRRVARAGLRFAKTRQSQRPPTPEDSIEAFLGFSSSDVQAHRPRRPKNVFANGDNVLLSYHTPLLHTLRQGEAAPGVAIVAGQDDHLFSPERILGSLANSEVTDFMVVVEGQHAMGDRRPIIDQVMALFPRIETRKLERAAARQHSQPLKPLRGRLFLPPCMPVHRASKLSRLADMVPRTSA